MSPSYWRNKWWLYSNSEHCSSESDVTKAHCCFVKVSVQTLWALTKCCKLLPHVAVIFQVLFLCKWSWWLHWPQHVYVQSVCSSYRFDWHTHPNWLSLQPLNLSEERNEDKPDLTAGWLVCRSVHCLNASCLDLRYGHNFLRAQITNTNIHVIWNELCTL